MDAHRLLWELNQLPYSLFASSIDDSIYEDIKIRIQGKGGSPKVLDLGCGSGEVSKILLPICKEIVLVDFSSNAINTSRSKLVGGKVTFHISKIAEFLDSTTERFDAIIICRSLYDRNPSKIIQKASERLASGGWLVIVLPKKDLAAYCSNRGCFSFALFFKSITPRILHKLHLIDYNLLDEKEIVKIMAPYFDTIGCSDTGKGTHIFALGRK